MKYVFTVIIHKETSDSLGTAISIPKFNVIRKKLSDNNLESIKNNGLDQFSKDFARALLTQKDENDELIDNDGLMQKFLSEYYNKGKDVKGVGKHDIQLNFEIDFSSAKSRFRFFEKILAPLMRLTILMEISAGFILEIGSLQLTESSLIPMDPKTAKYLSIGQATFSTLFSLWLIFSSPGMAFMTDLGIAMDTQCRKLKNWLCCNAKKNNSIPQQPISTWTNVKIKTMQSLFFIQVANNLFSDATQDYQELNLLAHKIDESGASIFPSIVLYIASWVEFCFNQLNDPIMIFSMLFYGFMMVRMYFTSGMENKLQDEEAASVDFDITSLPKQETIINIKQPHSPFTFNPRTDITNGTKLGNELSLYPAEQRLEILQKYQAAWQQVKTWREFKFVLFVIPKENRQDCLDLHGNHTSFCNKEQLAAIQKMLPTKHNYQVSANQ